MNMAESGLEEELLSEETLYQTVLFSGIVNKSWLNSIGFSSYEAI